MRGCRGVLPVRHRLQAVTSVGSYEPYKLMADQFQRPLDGDQIAAILTAISPDRFKTYLAAAGHRQERALKLYLWNAKLGEAFHMPIQAVEIALRNSITWHSPRFLPPTGGSAKTCWIFSTKSGKPTLRAFFDAFAIANWSDTLVRLSRACLLAFGSVCWTVGTLHQSGAASFELLSRFCRRTEPGKTFTRVSARSQRCGTGFFIMSR